MDITYYIANIVAGLIPMAIFIILFLAALYVVRTVARLTARVARVIIAKGRRA